MANVAPEDELAEETVDQPDDVSMFDAAPDVEDGDDAKKEAACEKKENVCAGEKKNTQEKKGTGRKRGAT